MIIVNGLSSEDLRSELLDLFDVDEDLSIATIEAGVRKFEANKRTTSYVQGQGRKSDLFQVSNYKKGQRQSRREYALQNYYCDHCDTKGHTVSRCPNKSQNDDDSSESDDGNQSPRKGNKSTSHVQVMTQDVNSESKVDEDRFVSYLGASNLNPYN